MNDMITQELVNRTEAAKITLEVGYRSLSPYSVGVYFNNRFKKEVNTLAEAIALIDVYFECENDLPVWVRDIGYTSQFEWDIDAAGQRRRRLLKNGNQTDKTNYWCPVLLRRGCFKMLAPDLIVTADNCDDIVSFAVNTGVYKVAALDSGSLAVKAYTAPVGSAINVEEAASMICNWETRRKK